MTVEMPPYEHDYYEILQVHPKATLAVIKKAYRTLMLEQGAHPDQGGSAALAARITEAYKTLSDADKRADYDRWYLSRMGYGAPPRDKKAKAAPKEPPKEAPKEQPKTSPLQQEPEAAAKALIVACPKCRTKNRVRSQEMLVIAKCSKCGQHLNRLPNIVLDLKEHLLAAVADHLGRAALPKWIKIGIPVVMLLASASAIAYTFQDAIFPSGDAIEKAEQLRHEEKYDQAADLLQKALGKEPGNPRLHEKLGDVYTKQMLLDDALLEYNKAIRLNPTNSYLYTLQGNTYLGLGRLAEAELAYKNALKLDPQLDQALANLGNVYARQRRFNEAEQTYQNALRSRQNADVLYNLGMVYQWDGKRPQAADAFRNALIADPNHRSSMISLASLYYEQHRYDLAAAQLVKASHLKHVDLDLHLKLADIYERTGRKREAIVEWQTCLEQGKEQPEIVEAAKRALQRLGVNAG
jgi:tetratricopeptide (TPR) repeat protein